ncbi:hypothetical protein [Velocimicrobium porci]|uniref:Uncharacterized protein n=1 Tax=Velocimicrobium porci TaxID=2606634 RepID=A0A6L5Y0J0_9FIRM|nr:hypothetical protein [Velocimicrobium porci]MSS63703.1 hypothetical protein [Velocimicrobium porci]
MSLKQECIDMINLIIEPLKKNDYDFYDLETDSIRDFCEKTGEDITYSDCQGCENYGKDCPYKKTIRVDVSFWDGADCQRNYIFGNNQVLGKGICSIKNRKQLMSEMLKLKSELEEYKNWCAEFREYYEEYLKYAKEFAKEVKEKYFLLFGLVQTDILPIIFHTDYNYRNGEIDYTTQGNLQIIDKQNLINVYCCMDNVEETKRTIRHEVLHYMLYIAGMKYKDDDAIFHYFCGEFDAHAYKDLKSDEQDLYDQLTNALSMMEKIFQEKNISEEKYTSNYIAILIAVGCPEDGEAYENGMELLKLFKIKSEIA